MKKLSIKSNALSGKNAEQQLIYLMQLKKKLVDEQNKEAKITDDLRASYRLKRALIDQKIKAAKDSLSMAISTDVFEEK